MTARGRLWLGALLVCAVIVLVGLVVGAAITLGSRGSAPAPPPVHLTIPSTTPGPLPSPAPLLVASPITADIPSLGVHADRLTSLGLLADHTIETPPLAQPQLLGFYNRGGAPCVVGPAEIPFALIGHIDGKGQRGALWNLKHLAPGDLVTVGLDNGRSCTYRIDSLIEVAKASFPTDRVWGPTPTAQIRIISCGGPFVGGKYGYKDNLIGMGTLIS